MISFVNTRHCIIIFQHIKQHEAKYPLDPNIGYYILHKDPDKYKKRVIEELYAHVVVKYHEQLGSNEIAVLTLACHVLQQLNSYKPCSAEVNLRIWQETH